ncbi:MAG: hypothetical protein WC863_03160 [Patescibacteria group bacterium]
MVLLGKLNSKKKLIIFSSLAFIIIILLIGLFVFSKKGGLSPVANIDRQPSASAPDFLNKTEKAKLGISSNLKVQALGREANGEVSVYKVINNDSDIVTNPSKIGPISPPALESAK